MTTLQLLELARTDPARLVAWLDSEEMSPGKATFAAEILGKEAAAEVAAPCLLRLTQHSSPLVREGAVYGLETHKAQGDVRARLEEMAASDPSWGVRQSAAEALSDD